MFSTIEEGTRGGKVQLRGAACRPVVCGRSMPGAEAHSIKSFEVSSFRVRSSGSSLQARPKAREQTNNKMNLFRDSHGREG
jgi:hypothetical protein